MLIFFVRSSLKVKMGFSKDLAFPRRGQDLKSWKILYKNLEPETVRPWYSTNSLSLNLYSKIQHIHWTCRTYYRVLKRALSRCQSIQHYKHYFINRYVLYVCELLLLVLPLPLCTNRLFRLYILCVANIVFRSLATT